MKYKSKDYALATHEAIKDGTSPDAARVGLLRSLDKSGDRAKLADVTRELEKLLTKESGGQMIKVEFARALGSEERGKILNSFDKKDRVNTTVVPELIAGVRITYDEERELDFTLLSKLKSLNF
jgi:F0F1-type ATP synthase delta subunit